MKRFTVADNGVLIIVGYYLVCAFALYLSAWWEYGRFIVAVRVP